MDADFKIPFYAKLALISISIAAFILIMHLGQFIIIPIVYATIIAILLNPLVNYLNRGLNKLVSISLAVIVATLVLFGVLYIVSSQVTMFSDTYPQLKEKFNTTSTDLVQWISEKFNIRKTKINEWIKTTQSDEINNFAIGEKLTEAGQMVVTLMLLPAYLFMILFYKPLLLEFVRKLFRTEHHAAVVEILVKSKKIVQSYLVGLFFELIIMAVLYSAGLLLLGVDYAIILGITGAIVNIIPYIGKVVAIVLPMLIAFITKDSLTCSVLVFFVYMFIQFIDNHYIIPKIVASRVQINALISVIVVLVGGAIWGVSGMFLSIPLTAIIKVIFDHIEGLKPWGFLLGNIVPTASKFSFLKIKSNPRL
ncbi:MAG TPA: AI-2E family transporter [Bacteroidia bacterium]|jgi:predicted PurR-regulated permease PerM|nr:AI-2E family transporter [Bacteroidia bacterium]